MSSRQPPPGAPPSYAFANRLYRYNLRPVVLTIATLSALWALLSSIGFFRSISTERADNVPKLATFSIVLGALYAGMFALEAFGVLAAVTQRVPFVRIYAFLSAIAALIVIAAGLIQVIVHFTLKADIVSECTDLSENQTIAVYPFGLFGPVHHDILSPEDAASWCNDAWDHDSWADIVSLLITIFLAGLFSVIAFSYYRQMLDPSSVANSSRVPAERFGVPSHYNPPYYNSASVPNLGYDYRSHEQQFAPPPGPPPQREEGYDKPPEYLGGNMPLSEDKDDPFADFDRPVRSTS